MTWKRVGGWIGWFGGLIALVAGALWSALRAREKAGEEIGRIEAGRERLRDAASKKDDQGVLDEWRRSRG